MRIEIASDAEISHINQLIICSKSVWDYNERYLKAALPLIQITADWLTRNKGYSIYDEDLVGFLGIEPNEDSWYLEHLWIAPARMHSGYGRQAVQFMLDQCKTSAMQKIFLLPDPPAEGFYLKMGAELTGRKIPSRVDCGPIFNEMVFLV